MHKVAILALNHVVPFDLSIATEVFGRARLADGKLAYDVKVFGPSRTLRAEAFDIRVNHLLEDLRSANTVMPLERAGGQSQFIKHAPPSSDGSSIEPLLNWLGQNSHRALTLEQIAERGAMSPRTLNRKFQEQTGTTPLQWLILARVRQSQAYLEGTSQPVEMIAEKVGFGSATSLREHFRRVVGTSPQAYRRSFRSAQL